MFEANQASAVVWVETRQEDISYSWESDARAFLETCIQHGRWQRGIDEDLLVT